MFNKRRCKDCNKKIEKDFDFCPYCGYEQNQNKEDYGLLGKNDNIRELDRKISNSFMPLGNNSLFEKILSGAMKMLEKEMRNINQEEIQEKMQNPNMRTNVQLFINGKPVNLNEFQERVHQVNNPQKEEKSKKMPKISEELIKRSAKLPRKEAKTKITRLKEKLVYEINAPGLKDMNQVMINKLESSIEIKIFTEDFVYLKTIPVVKAEIKAQVQKDILLLEFKE